MKFSAYLRPQFTADVYNLVSNVEDPNGGFIPIFYKEVKLHFANDPNSVRSIAVCDEELPPGGMVKNIRDKTGFLFMGDTEYTITRVIPVFNVWQNLEGYQVTLAVSEYKMLSEVIVGGIPNA